MISLDNSAFAAFDCDELTQDELMQAEGGFLPVVAIYACWGVMAACSLIAAGFGAAATNNGH